MASYTYYNGTFGETDEIRIPLSDRAIYFGDGIYDAAIGYHGRIFLADEHIKRFLGNARRISIPSPPSYVQMSNLLNEVVRKADIEEFFLYFQISRSSKARTHSALNSEKFNILITVSDIEVKESERLIALISEEDRRHLNCDIKSLNLLPAVMASTHAESMGCDEAVFHRGQTVTECAHSNIAIITSGVLYTHPLSNLILPGITRARLLYACEKLTIPYRERSFTIDELYSADEILVTSTSKLCRRAGSINGISAGGKDPLIANALCHFLYNEYYDFRSSL